MTIFKNQLLAAVRKDPNSTVQTPARRLRPTLVPPVKSFGGWHRNIKLAREQQPALCGHPSSRESKQRRTPTQRSRGASAAALAFRFFRGSVPCGDHGPVLAQ